MLYMVHSAASVYGNEINMFTTHHSNIFLGRHAINSHAYHICLIRLLVWDYSCCLPKVVADVSDVTMSWYLKDATK